MIAAEVIVMATPVYFYTMSAQMKTLIDRTCARYTEINNKEFYFFATAAVNNKPALERTIDGFRGFTSCLNGPKEKGVILGSGVWNAGDVKKSDAFIQAYEMGKKVQLEQFVYTILTGIFESATSLCTVNQYFKESLL